MSDDVVTKKVEHEFRIVPFTRYAIVYNKSTQSTNPWSISTTLNGDKALCVCATEEEAKKIAAFLASSA